jgi:hypothetical protein
MEEKSYMAYASLVFLAVLIFLSNFIGSKLFAFEDPANFAAWFTLALFCFVCGYYANKTLGWQKGGKLIFAAVVATAIVSNAVVMFFQEYFNATGGTGAHLLLFSLRNVFLGAMGYFGMAISEVLALQQDVTLSKEKLRLIEETIKDAKKESELTIRDAQIKANKILNEAELAAKNTILTKERIEKELREFIQIEKELIKKYEDAS